MKAAMRAREREKLTLIRSLISEIKNKEIDLKRTFTEKEEVALLSTQAKRRKESADAFRKGDREELATHEEFELALIKNYLPKQLSREEVKKLIQEVIAKTGAKTKRDMGRVMGAIMPQIVGKFPGREVKSLVDEALS